MITPYRGNFHVEWLQKKANTAFAVNDMVILDSNGFVDLAVNNSPLVYGLVQKAITSASTDYASNTLIPVLVGDIDAEYLCDVSTGTAAQEDVGQWADIDDQNSIDVDASTYDIFFLTQYVSATQMVGKMSKKSGAAA